MIHPINIPEDLFASNPRRPQLFKPRPKVKISYGADGRRLGPDGAALEPISPGTNWNNVFMRTFIRRLAPQGMELQQQPGTKAEEVNEESGKFGAGGRKPSHVDIVDLSPSPSTSTPPNLMKDEDEEEEESEDTRNEAETMKEASKKSTADSTPDRPSPAAELLPEGSEGEEAEGDQLARMGSSSLPLQPDRALSQLISRRAVDAILRCCCPPLAGTEFARLDFSHLNSLFESGAERTAAQLELVPGRRGSRVWTKREKQAAKAEDEQEEAKEVEHRRRRCIRFHIASVLFSRSSVAVRVEAHNGLAQQLRLRVETHVHAVRGDQIGQCVQWLAQVEELGAEGETSFSVHIPLGERAQNVLLAQQQRRQGQAADGEDEEQFLMATMHGRILPAEDVVC